MNSKQIEETAVHIVGLYFSNAILFLLILVLMTKSHVGMVIYTSTLMNL